MRIPFHCIVIFCSAAAALSACHPQSSLYGYVDERGKVKIERKFMSAKPFSEGLAAVMPLALTMSGYGPWGFIDGSGKFIIKPTFSSAHSFSEGRAAVATKDGWGYIDKNGNWTIKPRFEEVGDFSDGVACVTVGPLDKHTGFKRTYGYVDLNGKWVIEPTLECGFFDVDELAFSEGLAVIRVDGKMNKIGNDLLFGGESFGYINKSGEIVIAPKFRGAESFSGGLAPVRVDGDPEAPFPYCDGLWGLIDRSGKLVVPPKYEMVTQLSDGKFELSLPAASIGKVSSPATIACLDALGKVKYTTAPEKELITFPTPELADDIFSASEFHDGLALVEPVDLNDRPLFAKAHELKRKMSESQNASQQTSPTDSNHQR